MRIVAATLPTVIFIAALSGPTAATEIVYEPVNPNFGGNPLNGSFLLNQAQAQNSLTDPNSFSSLDAEPTALDRFNDSLERLVLSRVASSLTSSLFGPSGELIPGLLETQDFTILIEDLGDGTLRITTTDKNTGDNTSFDVSSQL